jgi:hypothetical protein
MVGRPAAQRKLARAGATLPRTAARLRRYRHGDDNAPAGEVAEWLNAAVLKTVDPQGFGGSNPSLSATFESGVQPFWTTK